MHSERGLARPEVKQFVSIYFAVADYPQSLTTDLGLRTTNYFANVMRLICVTSPAFNTA